MVMLASCSLVNACVHICTSQLINCVPSSSRNAQPHDTFNQLSQSESCLCLCLPHDDGTAKLHNCRSGQLAPAQQVVKASHLQTCGVGSSTLVISCWGLCNELSRDKNRLVDCKCNSATVPALPPWSTLAAAPGLVWFGWMMRTTSTHHAVPCNEVHDLSSYCSVPCYAMRKQVNNCPCEQAISQLQHLGTPLQSLHTPSTSLIISLQLLDRIERRCGSATCLYSLVL